MKLNPTTLSLPIFLAALAAPSHAQECLGLYEFPASDSTTTGLAGSSAIDEGAQVAVLLEDIDSQGNRVATAIRIRRPDTMLMDWDVTATVPIPPAFQLYNAGVDIEGDVVVHFGSTTADPSSPWNAFVCLRDTATGAWAFGPYSDLRAQAIAYRASGAQVNCGGTLTFLNPPSLEFGYSCSLATVSGQVLAHVGDPLFNNVCIPDCAPTTPGCFPGYEQDGAVWAFTAIPPSAGNGASTGAIALLERTFLTTPSVLFTQARFGHAVASCASSIPSEGRLLIGVPDLSGLGLGGGLVSFGAVALYEITPAATGNGLQYQLVYVQPGSGPSQQNPGHETLGRWVAIADEWAFASGGSAYGTRVFERTPPATLPGVGTWAINTEGLPLTAMVVDQSATKIVGAGTLTGGAVVGYSLNPATRLWNDGPLTDNPDRGTSMSSVMRTSCKIGAASVNGVLRFDCGGYLENYDFGDQAQAGVPVNSLGSVARLDLTGSFYAEDNDLTILASGVPTNSLGYFLTSRAVPLSVPMTGTLVPGLYLDSPIGRILPATSSGSSGTIQITLDLKLVPLPWGTYSAMAGESIQFQLWHRDLENGQPVFRFSERAGFTFQ